jgi:predicted phosphodiesterase
MIRLAVLSDIHGNLAALDAVLNDVARQGAERLVCLGDVAASGPQPALVLERLRAQRCLVVMGNVDAWLLTPTAPESDSDFHAQVWDLDSWCLAHLGAEHLRFVQTFQKTLTLSLGGVSVLCCHGYAAAHTHRP